MDFTASASIRRVLYLLAIIAGALFIASHEYVSQSVWLLFTALFFAHVTLERGLLTRTAIILVGGALAALVTLLGGVLAGNIVPVIGFLVLVTAACTWLGLKYDVCAYPVLLVNVAAVLSIYDVVSFSVAGERALAVLCGVLMAAVAQVVLVPHFKRDEYNRIRKITFYHLRHYATAVFDSLTSADYPDAVYYYERCLHKEKVKCMHGITALIRLEQEGMGEPGFTATQIQNIFALLVDISQIRRRNSDHTAFALCAPELVNLEQVIVQLLDACARQNIEQLSQLLEVLQSRVMQLDDNLENIIKVAAREPVVFVLFRTALQKLYDDVEGAVS